MNQLFEKFQNFFFRNEPAAFFFFAVIFLLVLAAGFFGAKIAELKLKSSLKEKIRLEREDAVKRSRAVLGGLAAEQVAAFLPDFPCNPADCRFVGKPVDFIAFPGSCEGGEIREILLIEVKSGDSQLSKREKEIRNCVKAGKIRYVEYRVN